MIGKLDEALSGLPNPVPDVSVCGDLNFPAGVIQWGMDENGDPQPTVLPHRNTDSEDFYQERRQAELLLNLMAVHNLQQVVDTNTHGQELLDLFFTNNHHLVHHVSTESWPTVTDHDIVKITVNYKLGRNNSQRSQESDNSTSGRYKRLHFPEAQWEEINTTLAALDWSPMEEMEPAAGLCWFHEQVLGVLEELVPTRDKKAPPKHHIPHHRRSLFKKLAKLKRALVKEKTAVRIAELLEQIRTLELQLTSEYEEKEQREEIKVLESIRSNPKSFFTYAQKGQKTREKIGPFVDDTGNINTDPAFTVKALKKQYESVFSVPHPHMNVENPAEFFNTTSTHTSNIGIEDVSFTPQDLQDACLELNANSAAGDDGVPAALLKNCRVPLSIPLYIFWRKSMDLGVIVSDLLLAIICPIHKGGSREIPKTSDPSL